MRVKRVLFAAAILIAGALAAPGTFAHAATPTAPYTALVLNGYYSSDILRGQLALDRANATFTATPSAQGGLLFTATGATQIWSIRLSPPTGSTWTVGTSYTAYENPNPGDAVAVIVGNGVQCSSEIMTLTIKQADVDPATTKLTRFAAAFTSTCSTGPLALAGDIRWNSTVGYSSVVGNATTVAFGDQVVGTVGAAKTVTFTGSGSTPVAISAVSVVNQVFNQFVVSADTCTGATLSYGQTCTIQIAPHLVSMGNQAGELALTDNTAAGADYVTLTGNGADPRQVTTSSDSFEFDTLDLDLAVPDQTVTMQATGDEPVTFSTASLTGNTAPFSIVSDTCSTKTLNPQQTCAVTIHARATSVGTYDAYLILPDNSHPNAVTLPIYGMAVVGAAGTYFPVASERILDTRSGIGAPKAALGAGHVIRLQVIGVGRIARSGVSAVVLNLTATGQTASTYLTAYPDGTSLPTASNLNIRPGLAAANMVTVRVGADGIVDIYNHAGSVQVIADTIGYYGSDDSVIDSVGSIGYQYHSITPVRVLDTRTGSINGPLKARNQVTVKVTFGSSVAPHVEALAVNVTAVNPTSGGYLSTYALDPTAVSSLNFNPGSTVANMSITLGSQIAVYNGSPGTVNVLIDVVGFYDDGSLAGGSRFFPTNPTRITDTRYGIGARPLTANSTATVTTPTGVLTAPVGLLNPQYSGLDLNVTAVAPTASTYNIVWSADLKQPTVSNLNPAAGQTVANSVFSGFNTAHQFDIYNHVGSVNMIADVNGVFEIYPFSGSGNQTALAPAQPSMKAGKPTAHFLIGGR